MHQVRSNTRLYCQHLRVAKNSWKFCLIQSVLVLSFSSCFPSACVITSRQWLIWQFSFCERINLSKVTANRNALTKTNKSSSHLGYSESYPLILFCNHTSKYGHTHTCKHKHSQAQRLAPTQIYFPSPWEGRSAHTHTRIHRHTNSTHTHWEALQSARLDVQPRCCTELMKSGCHAPAWQVSLTKQIPIYMQHGRRRPCQMLMPGTL